MEKKFSFKKEIGLENFVFLVCFFGFFIGVGSVMGGINMLKTMMETGFDLLINICFYLMAVAVLAGAVSGLFSEFGVVALINNMLAKLMKPLYDLPGAASLGMLNCYLSDNPAILTFADDDNFRRYFKQYQLPALTNLGTAFGMGFITTTAMMGLNVKSALPAALIGNVGAIAGSIVSVRLMIFFSKRMFGTDAPVSTKQTETVPEHMRTVRTGSAGSRFIQAMIDGGKIWCKYGRCNYSGRCDYLHDCDYADKRAEHRRNIYRGSTRRDRTSSVDWQKAFGDTYSALRI